MRCQNAWRVMPAPRPVTNKASLALFPSNFGLETARYCCSQWTASSPNGTSRSFEPLPSTRTTPAARIAFEGLKPDKLRYAQARSVERLEHGAVAQTERGGEVRGAEQRLDIRFGKPLGKARRALR